MSTNEDALEAAVSKRIAAANARSGVRPGPKYTKALPLTVTTLAELPYAVVLQYLFDSVAERLQIPPQALETMKPQVEVLDEAGELVAFERIRVTLAPKEPDEPEGSEGSSDS